MMSGWVPEPQVHMNEVPHRVRVILRSLGLPNTRGRRHLVTTYVRFTSYHDIYYTHARADDVTRYLVGLILMEWLHPNVHQVCLCVSHVHDVISIPAD